MGDFKHVFLLSSVGKYSCRYTPQLITLLNDEELYTAEAESQKIWAPIHAWRILSELKAEEALPSLIVLLNKIDDDINDWIEDELPDVFSGIGPASIPFLIQHIEKNGSHTFSKSCACRSLLEIVRSYPDHRNQCIEALTRILGNFKNQHPFLNASIIYFLVDLNAIESIGTIRDAFSHDCVDLALQGDIEDVEILLSLRKQRDTPKKIPPSIQRLRELLNMVASKAPGATDKVGRNELCPCGSGKKYKKCCLVN